MTDTLVELYDEFAGDYERTRVPRFRPFLKRLLQYYDTRPGSQVLDAACGTGLAATMVAPRVGHGGKIVGVDRSARMLDIARHKAAGFGFGQCEFVQGDILKLNAPADSFDLIICSFGLWDPPQALFAEFYQLLKPQGALLAQTWGWGRERDAVGTAYKSVLHEYSPGDRDERVRQVRAEYAKHTASWAGLETPEDYETALRSAGFSQEHVEWFEAPLQFKNLDELIDFYNVGSSARCEIAAMDVETRIAFRQAARSALEPLLPAGRIEFKWRAMQVSARK